MLIYTNILVIVATAAVLIYVSITDIREHRIPNKVMFPSLFLALLVALASPDRWSLLLGGLVAGALLLLPVFIYGLERAGGGDVKLALFIGLVLGWPAVVPALVVAFCGAFLIGTAGIIARQLKWKSSIAFAPFLTLGWITTVVFLSRGLFDTIAGW